MHNTQFFASFPLMASELFSVLNFFVAVTVFVERAYTLRSSTSSFFCDGSFSEIESRKLFAHAGFEP
jgi:hypothetical protein